MLIDELIRKRTVVKAKVIAFHTFLKKFDNDPSKYRELPLSLEKTKILLSGFDDIQSQKIIRFRCR